jgi:hypothetical protein
MPWVVGDPDADFYYRTRIARQVTSEHEGWQRYELYLGPGQHELRWTVGLPRDKTHFRQLHLARLRVDPVQEEYQSWADQHWAAAPEVSNPNATLGPWQDPKADPDQDQYSNEIEFAFGSDPRSAASIPPSAQFDGQSVVWPLATAVNWRVWTSKDLLNWTDEGLVNEESPKGIMTTTNAPRSAAFFRIDIDVLEPAE